jgi:hypothetical protein
VTEGSTATTFADGVASRGMSEPHGDRTWEHGHFALKRALMSVNMRNASFWRVWWLKYRCPDTAVPGAFTPSRPFIRAVPVPWDRPIRCRIARKSSADSATRADRVRREKPELATNGRVQSTLRCVAVVEPVSFESPCARVLGEYASLADWDVELREVLCSD